MDKKSDNGHEWHEKVFASMSVKCCVKCGFLLNYDKPNKECPGFVRVSLRDEKAQFAGQRKGK